jgi:hypothetical protein
MEAILPEGVICRKCLTRKIKESAPACVRGKYMYYGEPADRLYVESGLPKFKNDAGISVYDLGGEYAVCTNYTIYGINTKIGTLPAVNCERHKSISAALDAGLREINRELEKHVAEYPLKVAEIRH